MASAGFSSFLASAGFSSFLASAGFSSFLASAGFSSFLASAGFSGLCSGGFSAFGAVPVVAPPGEVTTHLVSPSSFVATPSATRAVVWRANTPTPSSAVTPSPT